MLNPYETPEDIRAAAWRELTAIALILGLGCVALSLVISWFWRAWP